MLGGTMRGSTFTIGALVALLAVPLLAAAPANALPPRVTPEVCTTTGFSPVRGEGENATLQGGPFTVNSNLPEFNPALGTLLEARMNSTAVARAQVRVTYNSGGSLDFTATVGNASYAGKEGTNGYFRLTPDPHRAVVSVLATGTPTTSPIVTATASGSATYTPALWSTLGGFRNMITNLPSVWTSSTAYTWDMLVDEVKFTTCVSYLYSPPNPAIQRVAGVDRFETAANIATESYPAGAPVVYVANGLNYPDALSAGPAAAHAGGPLLLVAPGSIPASVSTTIAALDPDHIVVIGGTGSVSASVYTQLAGLAPTIERIAGTDRYDTSRQVADTTFGSANIAYIATGQNFPDALAAGGAAGLLDAPVILVNGQAGDLDPVTADLLDDLGVTSIRVIGATASVSDGILHDLEGIATTVRLAGANRYDTARAVNADAFASSDLAFFATGLNFPDALAGSAWAAKVGAPLFTVQTSCVPSGVLDDIVALGVDNVVLLGGTSSLGAGVANFTACP